VQYTAVYCKYNLYLYSDTYSKLEKGERTVQYSTLQWAVLYIQPKVVFRYVKYSYTYSYKGVWFMQSNAGVLYKVHMTHTSVLIYVK